MFCKWCGKELAATDTKCGRCGKDIPALSDCGGFFDLVPKARIDTVETLFVQPAPQKREPIRAELMREESVKRDAKGKNKKNSSWKADGILTAVICCCVVLVFGFLFALHNEVHGFSDGINQLENNLEVLASEVGLLKDSLAEESETEMPAPSEMVIPNEPVLSKQDVFIAMGFQGGEEGGKVTSTIDLGEFADSASTVFAIDEENKALVEAEFELSKSQGYAAVTIEQSSQFGYGYREGMVEISIQVDEAGFGTLDGEVLYQWQYRPASEQDWIALDQAVFTQEDDLDHTVLQYKFNDIHSLLDEYDDDIELQCVLKRKNTEGGTLTIMIDGIVFTQDTFNQK